MHFAARELKEAVQEWAPLVAPDAGYTAAALAATLMGAAHALLARCPPRVHALIAGSLLTQCSRSGVWMLPGSRHGVWMCLACDTVCRCALLATRCVNVPCSYIVCVATAPRPQAIEPVLSRATHLVGSGFWCDPPC